MEIPPGGGSMVYEPNVGGHGNAILMTGNWSAHISTNNGMSWRYLSPFTTFPNSPGPFSAGFCCDQRVAQDPTRNLIFWYLQYNVKSDGTNGIRIAVFRGSGALGTVSAALYDYSASTFGYSGPYWLDFPHMQATENYLYFTSNVFRHWFGLQPDEFAGSIIARLPLDTLAAGQALTNPIFADFRASQFPYPSIAPVNGADDTMYFGVYRDSTTITVLRWRDVDLEPTYINVEGLSPTYSGVSAFTCSGPPPESYDPCVDIDNRIQSGWVTSTEVGFMWNSGLGGVYPRPFVRVVVLDRSPLDSLFRPLPLQLTADPTFTPIPSPTPNPTFTPIPTSTPAPTFTPIPSPTNTPLPPNVIKSQPNISDNNYAFLFPSVAVNGRGDQGGSVVTLGGTRHPSITAIIRDATSGDAFARADVLLGSFTPPDTSIIQALKKRRWGDYTGVITHEKHPYSWLGTGWLWEPDQNWSATNGYKPRPYSFWFMRSDAQADPGLWQPVCTDYYPSDLPKNINDFTMGVTTSNVVVPDTALNRFTAARVRVYVSLEHPKLDEVEVFLKAPGILIPVTLFRDIGGSTVNFSGFLDDWANTHVARGPWFGAGTYRPEYALGTFAGLPSVGTWQLQLQDDTPNGLRGRVTNWALGLCKTEIQNPTTVGVFRPSNATFYLRNQNSSGAPDYAFPYGAPGDFAVAGDWNDDGLATVGVFRAGVFYLRNSNSAGPADLTAYYGVGTDLPITGNWDGYSNSTTIPPLHRDSIGIFRGGNWFLRNSNTSGVADLSFVYGLANDKFIAGDWNGDSIVTPGVFRNGTWYLRNSNTSGVADLVFQFGVAGDLPVVGDWDGDGVTTIGLFWNGIFYLRNSNTSGSQDLSFNLGTTGDEPVAGDWDGRR